MIKGTIQQENITLINIFASNTRAPKYVKQILMDIKGETDRNTVIIGNFNTALTSVDRSSRQKTNKETAALNDTLNQMDLFDIYRAFHCKSAEYTFFSNAHGTFSRIYHMLEHRTSLNKIEKVEIIPSIFSDHNGMKLEINHRKRKLKNIQ